MLRDEHWNHVYETKESNTVSWYQPAPTTSLTFLQAAGLNADSCVIDVGAGDSRFVDSLLDLGVKCVTVLDVSSAAISRTRHRLGDRAASVNWIVADVTSDWSALPVDYWHDRAVFHFLVEAADRRRYVEHLQQSLKPGGCAVIATFAPDGPSRCSGLPVARYSPDSLMAELGAGFVLQRSAIESHHTPAGTTQSFLFALLRLKETERAALINATAPAQLTRRRPNARRR
jgi:SAM-dependent methyltransferase